MNYEQNVNCFFKNIFYICSLLTLNFKTMKSAIIKLQVILLVLAFSVAGCNVNKDENLSWLDNLIDLSKTDKTGNYWGCIWLENYKGKDIYVTNMMLGSGGVMYWFFDCSGNHFISKNWQNETCPACSFVGNHHVVIEDEEGFQSFVSKMKLENPIYSSFSLPCKR